jgi:hypothetical protein
LPDVATAVKGLQSDAIEQYRGAIGKEDGSVKGEGVAALDCGVACNWKLAQSLPKLQQGPGQFGPKSTLAWLRQARELITQLKDDLRNPPLSHTSGA